MIEITKLTEDAVSKAKQRRKQQLSVEEIKQIKGGKVQPSVSFPDETTMGMYPYS